MKSLRFVLFMLIAASTVHADEPLRYAPESGRKFSYVVDIKVDDVERKRNYKGQIHYTADRVNDEQVTFDFVSTIRDFSRSRTKTKFSVSPLGKVQSIDGVNTLPFLLGDLTTLLFDRLPELAVDTWSWKDDTSILCEENRFSSIFPQFGYGRPRFGPRIGFVTPSDSKTSATETANYTVKSRKGDLATIETIYQLRSEPDVDGRKIEADGKATWVFNQADGITESLEMSRTVSVVSDKITVRTPITVSIQRISEEELAKQKAEAEKRLAEMKKERSRPLTDDEVQSLLTDIRSGDRGRVHRAMITLSKKEDPEPNEEIVAAAIKAGEDRFVRMMSKRVVEVFGTAEDVAQYAGQAEIQELNEAYRTGHGRIESTGRKVDDSSELVVGQIVQYQDRAGSPFWNAGTVKQVLDSGNVIVKRAGRIDRVHELPIGQIQLAPDGVKQPKDPLDGPINRTWRDASGTHATKAELLNYADGKVKLKRTDGKVVTIPASKLSKADQKFLDAYAEKKAKEDVPNPFE